MAGLSLSVKHKRQFYYFMTGLKNRFYCRKVLQISNLDTWHSQTSTHIMPLALFVKTHICVF